MKIDDYKFGRIVIDGKTYTNDLIVCHDQVKENWRRQAGHELAVSDLERAIQMENPAVLIVGKGNLGLMNILPETEQFLQSRGIRLVAARTSAACEVFNQLQEKRCVMGAFHLTC
jgi:hypothetical protein